MTRQRQSMVGVARGPRAGGPLFPETPAAGGEPAAGGRARPLPARRPVVDTQPAPREAVAASSAGTARRRIAQPAEIARISAARARPSTKIRVVIAVDVRLYREGLAGALGSCGSVHVLATADSSQDALTAVETMRPDVLLLDTSVPGSLDLVQTVAAAGRDVRVVALALGDDDVMGCAEAGIAGFVRRDASLDDVVTTIQSVARGELLCSPRVAAALLRRLGALAATHRSHTSPNGLTRREHEIIGLIDQGLSNKDIASRLGIEVATVKNHIHNLLEKLHLHRRGEAAAYLRTEAPRRASAAQGEHRHAGVTPGAT